MKDKNSDIKPIEELRISDNPGNYSPHVLFCEYVNCRQKNADRTSSRLKQFEELEDPAIQSAEAGIAYREQAVDAMFKALPSDAYGTIGSGEMYRVLDAALAVLAGKTHLGYHFCSNSSQAVKSAATLILEQPYQTFVPALEAMAVVRDRGEPRMLLAALGAWASEDINGHYLRKRPDTETE